MEPIIRGEVAAELSRRDFLRSTSVLGAAALEAYAQRFAMTPDGMSYLDLSDAVVDGRWSGLVNAYWSPLFSWLLVPLLALKVELLRATKILNLLIGFYDLTAYMRGRLGPIRPTACSSSNAFHMPIRPVPPPVG